MPLPYNSLFQHQISTILKNVSFVYFKLINCASLYAGSPDKFWIFLMFLWAHVTRGLSPLLGGHQDLLQPVLPPSLSSHSIGVTHPLAPALGGDSCFLLPGGDQDALLGLIWGEKRVHLRALPLLLLCCGSPCNVACNFLTYQSTQMFQCGGSDSP